MRYKARSILSFIFLLTVFITIPVLAQEKPELKIGGALRFNYNYSDWKPENRERGGDLGFDLFRLNADASYKKLLLSAEYRFYPSSSGGGMLKSGWIGYQLNDANQVQLGLVSVPFGIQPYTANNYFFNINYYLGLEDDSDMGIKYHYQKKQWEIAFAFFKNADVLDFSENTESSPDRYSYDVAGRNKEVNQLNVQFVYHWGERWKQQFGVSGLLGGLYNLDTREMGARSAFAIHYMAVYKRWDFRMQYTSFRMNPHNKSGESRDIVRMAAYGSSYNVAAKADTYIASLAYAIPIHKGVLDEVRFYNDFSMMHKRVEGFNDSYQNITGCLVSMGPVYTYVDYALGKNQAWLGKDWGGAFAQGMVSNQWNARFNINIGYYF